MRVTVNGNKTQSKVQAKDVILYIISKTGTDAEQVISVNNTGMFSKICRWKVE